MIHIINLYKRELEKKEFPISSGKTIQRAFPDDIKIYEIYKSFNLEFGLDLYTYKFLFNGKRLSINDHGDGFFIFNGLIIISECNKLFSHTYFGKIVMAKLFICNNQELPSEKIGILNSVKDLKKAILNYNGNKKIKTLIIENYLIEDSDIMSLFSLGINNDFTFFIEFEE